LDANCEGWEERLAAYAAGLVSYIDGTKCLKHFPEDLGCRQVEVPVANKQLFNFRRCLKQLRTLNHESFETLAEQLRAHDPT
jgi:hypothetical protein